MQNHPIVNSLFSIGFRVFFLLGACYAVVSMGIWVFLFQGNNIVTVATSVVEWHAHEMFYGYSMAVIAGFLLTAVQNWTGLPTTTPASLAFIVITWLIARVALILGPNALVVAFIFDSLFLISLNFAIISPIIKSKNWKQMGIVSKLFLFLMLNTCYYLGAMGILESGVEWGISGGFFIVFALVMTMARRVFPFFISKGLSLETPVANSKFADVLSLVAYLIFALFEMVWDSPIVRIIAALLVAGACIYRLLLWYRPGIWQKPLLWSLWLSYAAIAASFVLIAIAESLGLATIVAKHLLAVGGLGVMTLSMMARVSLGHTGRSIHAVPSLAVSGLACIIAAAIARAPLALLFPAFYIDMILASQLLWIAAFTLFIIAYTKILTTPRA